MSPALARWIALGGGLGLLPKAPGTWASAAAVAVGTALHLIGGFPLLAVATLVVGVVGWIAVQEYLKTAADPDPSVPAGHGKQQNAVGNLVTRLDSHPCRRAIRRYLRDALAVEDPRCWVVRP